MSASLNDLNKTGALACELAEAASRWDLDRLKYLDDIEQPNRIQLAFIQIYRNLQLYRPFIPDAVLQFNSAESQGPEDDDDDEIQENVTLVFTDIQNSTVLWETCGPAMRKAVKAHHAVMRRCIAQRDGYEVWPPTMPLTKGRAPCSWVVGRARLFGFMQQQCVAVGRCAWRVGGQLWPGRCMAHSRLVLCSCPVPLCPSPPSKHPTHTSVYLALTLLSGTFRTCQLSGFWHFSAISTTFASMCKHVVTRGGGGGLCVYFFKSARKGHFRNVWVGGGGGGHIFQRSTTHWTVHTNMALHCSSIFTLNHCHRQHSFFQAGLGPH